jgi:hypothetical protein
VAKDTNWLAKAFAASGRAIPPRAESQPEGSTEAVPERDADAARVNMQGHKELACWCWLLSVCVLVVAIVAMVLLTRCKDLKNRVAALEQQVAAMQKAR